MELSTDESRILVLLAQGLTDQQVAERLGISRCTLQRRLRRVMDGLGARSRFQAGYLLALRLAARIGDWVTA